MDNNRKYSIYIIKNTVNDKVYIGQTSQSVKERFNQHKKPSTQKTRGTYKIYNAINKYGKDKFYIETLETGLTSDEADKAEIEYIAKYNSYFDGYNSTKGADGKTISSIQDINKLKEMYNDGCTIISIAKYFKVHQVTVRRTLESLGIPNRYKKISKDYLLKNKDKKTNKQMAKELGVHEETISRAFKKYEIARGRGYSNKLNKQNQFQLSQKQKKKIKEMWGDRRYTLKDITNAIHSNPRTIINYAERNHFPKRKQISMNVYKFMNPAKETMGQMNIFDYISS